MHVFAGGGVYQLVDELLDYGEVEVNFTYDAQPADIIRICGLAKQKLKGLEVHYNITWNDETQFPSCVFSIDRLDTNKKAAKFLLMEEYE